MRSQRTIEQIIWRVMLLQADSEEDTMEHAVRMGLIMGLQFALGADFGITGDSIGRPVCGMVVEGEDYGERGSAGNC